jgi:hypothetical protein
MSQVTDAPVGRWSGTVTYEGKVDEYTVAFNESGSVSLSTPESTGRGSWSATGQDTFDFTVKEVFNTDESGAAPDKVLPGAAYVEIHIAARRSGATFAGSGTAQVRGADGSVLHSTTAETTASQLPAN